MSNRPTIRKPAPAHIRHERVRQWVAVIATLTQPDRIYWADGSQEEYDRLCADMEAIAFGEIRDDKQVRVA